MYFVPSWRSHRLISSTTEWFTSQKILARVKAEITCTDSFVKVVCFGSFYYSRNVQVISIFILAYPQLWEKPLKFILFLLQISRPLTQGAWIETYVYPLWNI